MFIVQRTWDSSDRLFYDPTGPKPAFQHAFLKQSDYDAMVAWKPMVDRIKVLLHIICKPTFGETIEVSASSDLVKGGSVTRLVAWVPVASSVRL